MTARQIEYRVDAISAADAITQAKSLARDEDYRILTLASVRVADDVAQPAEPVNWRTWTVRLAVRPA